MYGTEEYYGSIRHAVLPALAVEFVGNWSHAAGAYLRPILSAYFTFREPLLAALNWSHLVLAALARGRYARSCSSSRLP